LTASAWSSRAPAYARRLIQRRAAGYCPWHAHLFVGETAWHFAAREEWDPALVLVPDREDWPDADLSAVQGTSLYIIALEATEWCEQLARLAARAARLCAPVYVHCPQLQVLDLDVSHLAWAERNGGWPSYWSDAQEADYIRRRQRWQDAWEGAGCPETTAIR
jgi:hypothetical protein